MKPKIFLDFQCRLSRAYSSETPFWKRGIFGAGKKKPGDP
jgi:hypothetical protein